MGEAIVARGSSSSIDTSGIKNVTISWVINNPNSGGTTYSDYYSLGGTFEYVNLLQGLGKSDLKYETGYDTNVFESYDTPILLMKGNSVIVHKEPGINDISGDLRYGHTVYCELSRDGTSVRFRAEIHAIRFTKVAGDLLLECVK